MKTFILILLVGACLAATVQRPDSKKKRNVDASGNPNHSPGKATRGIHDILRQKPSNVRRESKNSDVDKRFHNYYYYPDYNYPGYYDLDFYYYGDGGYYYDYYYGYYYDDYYYGYWQGYWYGYYMGMSDGYDWGYVDGNANGFDIGFSNGFFDAKYKYSYYDFKKRDVGKRSASPMKRSKTGQDSNKKRTAALKMSEKTEKEQM